MSVQRRLLLWFGVTVGALASNDLKMCDSADRQYHVAITNVHGEITCGGSLIDESWILTDALCYQWGMKVVLGAHPGPGRTAIIMEPPVISYHTNGSPLMMMLKLPHPTKIEPVKLPACPGALTNENVQIAGYRLVKTDLITNQTDSREAIKLQCVKIKLSNCRKVKGFRPFYRCTDHQVEISSKDAGGAMVYKDMIYGVLMYGGKPGLDNPAPYMGVCYLLNWINAVITR